MKPNKNILIVLIIILFVFIYFVFNSITEISLKVKTNKIEKQIHLLIDHQIREDDE